MDANFMDTSEQALVKKPKPVGWFVAGLIAIAAGTGFAAYYLPLSAAHSKLVVEHKSLAKKAGELDHWLKADRATLASTEGKRAALRKFVDAGLEEQSKRNSEYELLKTTVERKLSAFVKAKLASVEVTQEGVVVAFQEKAVFRPRTSLLSPAGAATLCNATSSMAVANQWDVRVVTRANVSDKKYWETATERAASVASAMTGRCEISGERLSVAAKYSGDTDKPLAAAEILFTLAEQKEFLPSDAPSAEAPVTAKTSE